MGTLYDPVESDLASYQMTFILSPELWEKFNLEGINVDYSKWARVKMMDADKELSDETTYIGNVHRYELIYKYYCKYGSRQALGFCCSKEHAREMAKEFSSRGITSVAVFSDASGEYTEKRNVAI